jgi:hypothetical protein
MPEQPRPGEGMTGSRATRPAPTHIQHRTGDPRTHNRIHASFPRPHPVCAGPDHGQDRSSSLRCGRSVLTDGPHPAPPTQRPRTTKTPARTPLTKPRPFRDDSFRHTFIFCRHREWIRLGADRPGCDPRRAPMASIRTAQRRKGADESQRPVCRGTRVREPAEWSFALDTLELWPAMYHVGTVTEYWSRSTRLRILPVGLRGMASAKITFFGNL